jgi:battenin
MASGMVMMAIASTATMSWGFGVALFAAVITGIGLTLGEGTVIGFLKFYPPRFVNAYSSGTGFAGIAGAGLILGLRSATLPDLAIFLMMVPAYPIYFFCFNYLVKKQKLHGVAVYTEIGAASSDIVDEITDTETTTGNAVFSKEQVQFVFRHCWFLYLNLALVFFFEYVIIVCFADRATLKQTSGGFFNTHAFVILNFCYQFGVFIARTSLVWFKIEAVWIVTILQGVNFVVWWANAIEVYMDVWVEFAHMLFVGLMGGASFVNIAYIILKTNKLPNGYRETASNLNILFLNIGSVTASLFALLLDNTMLKQ